MTDNKANGKDDKLEDVQFGFSIVKTGDKGYSVHVSPDVPQPDNIDDIYAAVCSVKRNLEAQQFANVMQQVMTQVAMQAQGLTESGLVVPQGKGN